MKIMRNLYSMIIEMKYCGYRILQENLLISICQYPLYWIPPTYKYLHLFYDTCIDIFKEENVLRRELI